MEIKRFYDDTYGFPFVAYIPDDCGENPALIIQLHGAGERGEGGEDLDLVLVHGFVESGAVHKMQNAVLVMPQCPRNTFWVAKIERLRHFILEMVCMFHADASKIMLTGLSMGGFGTWYTAMAYPDLFAKIAPCCGGGMPWNAAVLNMPIWAFHGACDDVVSPVYSVEMVNAVKQHNPNVRFDLYEGVGHNSWECAYTKELMDWLLA